MAEAQAVWSGMLMAKQLGYANIVIRNDAMETVNSAKRMTKGFSPIYLVFVDIQNDNLLFIIVCFIMLNVHVIS